MFENIANGIKKENTIIYDRKYTPHTLRTSSAFVDARSLRISAEPLKIRLPNYGCDFINEEKTPVYTTPFL